MTYRNRAAVSGCRSNRSHYRQIRDNSLPLTRAVPFDLSVQPFSEKDTRPFTVQKNPAIPVPGICILFLSGLVKGDGGVSEWWHKLKLDSLPPESVQVEEVIDQYIDAGLNSRGITPEPQAEATTLLRPLTLDLNSRISTVSEVENFLAVDSPDQYRNFVDDRLADMAFGRNWHYGSSRNSMLLKCQAPGLELTWIAIDSIDRKLLFQP